MNDRSDDTLPSRTSVLAVGLEQYELPAEWDLPGAGRHAVEFAQWAIRQGVPPERVRLGCTWLDKKAGAHAVQQTAAQPVSVGNESLLRVIDELMTEGGDLLLVYWCGHGVAGDQLERRLLTADASEHNLANRFVADLQARFQSDIGAGFARQILIIDACASIMAHHDGEKRALPDSRMQPLRTRKARQDFYFATDVGEYAHFDKAAGTAAYTTAVLRRLTATEGASFPPDFRTLFTQVEQDLATEPHPRPVFLRVEVEGSGRERRFERTTRVVFGDRPWRTGFFVPRDQLGQLRDGASNPGGIRALYGMRGTGKSQIASAYAEECEAAGWELVAWITATSRNDIIRQFAGLASACGLTDHDTAPDQAVAALLDWLNNGTGRRLLVFDNVERFDDLSGLVPRGEVQVITTSTATSKMGASIHVGAYSRDQSVQFLSETTGSDDSSGAAHVAEELGDLPVALTQAATTIRLTGSTYQGYLTGLREHPLAITLHREDGDAYPEHVATALARAVDTVLDSLPDDAARDTAFTLLSAMSLLAESGIPRAWASCLGAAPVTTQLVVGRLIDTSILTQATHPGTDISIHRLLAAVLRETIHEGDVDNVVDSALFVLKSALAVSAVDTYLARRASNLRIAAQLATICGQPGSTPLLERMDFLDLTADVAYTALALHDPYPAIPLLEATATTSERLLGPAHTLTLTSVHNLAAAYESAGRLDKAIPLYEKSLADRERVLGPTDPATATSQDSLARAYRDSDDLRRAIPLQVKALAEHERILGAHHPATLRCCNNLASTYHAAGQLDLALALHERTLADREIVLGSHHPDTLASQNNLARVYESIGDLDYAISLHERTLTQTADALGWDHPDTFTSQNNLAHAYAQAGDLERAIPLYEQALIDTERVLGPEHVDTLMSRNNLAWAYHSAGDLETAIPLLEATLADRERVLGDHHPHTYISRNNLAYAYVSAGDFQRAIPLFEDTLTYRERTLGQAHPDTITNRVNLANAYHATGDRRAIALLERALVERQRLLGPSHPSTLATADRLDAARWSL